MDVDTTTTAPHPFHYYDWHQTAEDRMGDSAIHAALVMYLAAVLQQLLRDTPTFVALNLNIYTAPKRKQYPIAPDIAVYLGAQIDLAREQLLSWCTYEPDRPPPALVVEIASKGTWKRDVHDRPQQYEMLGVDEYVLYDPNVRPLLPGGRLRLWRRDGVRLVPVVPDAQGRCWSTVLDRYLVSDGIWLRLADHHGVRCPTAEEAARAEERAARDEERAAKEVAWAKLRELGIDPTTLDS